MARLRVNKKQDILRAATGLFAAQGFDGTTTLQISKEAGITEPVIYYHFKGKDDLFTRIIITTFAKIFSQMDTLPSKTETEFEKIENLISLLLDIVKKMPDEIYLAISTCPSRLKDPDGICHKSVQEMRRRLKAYLSGCLEKGILQGEFHSVPLDATVDLLSALLNGLIRQRSLKLKEVKGVKKTAVEFCRRSLVKNAFTGRIAR
jgi:AcrR family transcriptional regulator